MTKNRVTEAMKALLEEGFTLEEITRTAAALCDDTRQRPKPQPPIPKWHVEATF